MPAKTSKHPWIKWKGYPHFGKKLGPSDFEFVNSYVTNPNNIEKHKFYPLIYKQAVERKFKLMVENGSIKRYHSKLGANGKKESFAKQREIFYASHLDAQILSYYANVVIGIPYAKRLEGMSELNKSILAYRKIEKPDGTGKNNIDFAKEVFDEIRFRIKNDGMCAAIAFDITAFFDSLNHAHLMTEWKELLGLQSDERLPKHHYAIYKNVTNIAYVRFNDALKAIDIKHPKDLWDKEPETYAATHREFRKVFGSKGKVHPHPFPQKWESGKQRVKCGIAQGTPISAFLSNLYMWTFDKWAHKMISSLGGVYRRYSDDIVIICKPNQISAICCQILAEIKHCCKLEIKASKTQVTVFRQDEANILCKCITTGKTKPFQYLGFEFDGSAVLIRQASVSKFYRKMKTAVRIRTNRFKKIRRNHIPKFLSKSHTAELYKGPLYAKYSYQGKRTNTRNYLHYATDADRIFGGTKMRGQLRRAWNVLNNTIKHRLHNK